MTNLEWLHERTRRERSHIGGRLLVVVVALWAMIASLLYLTRARWPETVTTGVIALVLLWAVREKR